MIIKYLDNQRGNLYWNGDEWTTLTYDIIEYNNIYNVPAFLPHPYKNERIKLLECDIVYKEINNS